MQISPYLGGLGLASAAVAFNVALYYNTIIAWCLKYLVQVTTTRCLKYLVRETTTRCLKYLVQVTTTRWLKYLVQVTTTKCLKYLVQVTNTRCLKYLIRVTTTRCLKYLVHVTTAILDRGWSAKVRRERWWQIFFKCYSWFVLTPGSIKSISNGECIL